MGSRFRAGGDRVALVSFRPLILLHTGAGSPGDDCTTYNRFNAI